MLPFLYTSESFSVPTYGILYLIAYLASIAIFGLLATRIGQRFWHVVDIAFQFSIAGELGARLTFVVVEWDSFVAGAISMKQFLLAGRVVLGGILVGCLYGTWLFRRHKLPVLAVSDAALTGVAFGMGFGRLGCLASGCCYGKPTDWAWGITFHDPQAHALSGTPLDVALHPTQLVLFAAGMAMFGVLYWAFGRRRFDGQVAALFFMIAGVTRFLAELLRGDPRGATAGLATSQWIGIGMVLAGGLLWIVGARRNKLTTGTR